MCTEGAHYINFNVVVSIALPTHFKEHLEHSIVEKRIIFIKYNILEDPQIKAANQNIARAGSSLKTGTTRSLPSSEHVYI